MRTGVVQGRAGGDGVQQRNTERASDLLGGVDQGAGDSGVMVGHAEQGRRRQRYEHVSHAQADQQFRRHHVRQVGRVDRQLGQPQDAQRGQDEARCGKRPADRSAAASAKR